MTKIRTLQLYRGTTAQNDAYTGSAGELTMDTTTNELRLHDGSTAGGHVIGSGGSGSYHPDLFDHKWADHLLNDVSWLRADTFSWQDGGVYEAAYDHLADDITGKSLSSETIAGITIQFYLADDGHKICPASEESNVASIYSATGVAWYYIIDTANTRFKLPRTQFAFTGIRSDVGAFVEAGLPNITGQFSTGMAFGTITSTGAFTYVGQAGNNRGGSGSNDLLYTFNASRSNSIYGNSTSVQPQATQQYLYFYVGNFTQTALENTAGLNASLFNGKADLDFANTDMIDYVVEKQDPTSSNNYIWYRKYKSGWVEQGGQTASATQSTAHAIVLPVEMANANYFVCLTQTVAGNGYILRATDRTTTGFNIKSDYFTGSANPSGVKLWEVSGMAA